jgi:hypothetical protein
MKKDMFALCAFAASGPRATTDITANAHTRSASDFADISSSRLFSFFVPPHQHGVPCIIPRDFARRNYNERSQ